MWMTVASLLMGALPGAIKALAQARVDLKNAETEQQKIEAQERVDVLSRRVEALSRVADSPWTHVARALLLAPVALYWAKVVAWDKLFCPNILSSESGWCTTDPLNDWMMTYFAMILTFYFAGVLVDKIKR